MATLTPEETAKLEPTARKFAEAVKIGIDAFVEAGRVVAEAIDLDPKFPDKIAELSKGQFSAKFVRRFEKLGRGHVIPELIFCWDKPGITKLRQLSPPMQNYYLANGIEVVVAGGDFLLVDPKHLTKFQVKQVFEGDEIRTQAEQRAWLESEKSENNLKGTEVVEAPFTLCKSKGQIVFNRPCHFDIDDLMKILVNRK
jgi:hypothetical protein